MTPIRVTTPSRLHFGLLGWGEGLTRQFGGVGLMVEHPGLEVVVEPSPIWKTVGALSERAMSVALAVEQRLTDSGRPAGPLRIEVLRAPVAHVGLGVGTQLSLAVAKAMTTLAGLPETPVETLARLTGRGRRSGIGVHGFAHGGFIVDAGRRGGDEIPTCLYHEAFPLNWHVLVVSPGPTPGIHGPEEARAFGDIPKTSTASSDRLCRLVLLGLLPALIEVDIRSFGSALTEIQREVGEIFAPVQGGRFGRIETGKIVQRMTELGLLGIGQSSWGPTLYGFSDREEEERQELRNRLVLDLGIDPIKVYWTRASHSGAICHGGGW